MPTPRSHNDSRVDDKDDDLRMRHDEDGDTVEEEWEGPTTSPVISRMRHHVEIDDISDQDDLDAGETIYEVFDEL
jgi:hypothetical protein